MNSKAFKTLLVLMFFVLSIILSLCFSLPVSAQEEITITAYYPSPYGVYRELRSQRMAIGDAYYDNSQYSWEGAFPTIDSDADLVVEGNVGIGTTSPSTGTDGTGANEPLKLDVEGQVGATYYCDEDGNNCIDITDVGAAQYGLYGICFADQDEFSKCWGAKTPAYCLPGGRCSCLPGYTITCLDSVCGMKPRYGYSGNFTCYKN